MTMKYYFVEFIALLTRFFPLPVRTGIIRIGNPGPDSPVLLTGNYVLTVERVKRAVQGLNLFLLVANSKGINVWCAATGGHFTNHSVISALKTSGIEKIVNHREVILPQLAATGIEGKVIREKTGWAVKWGPVDARFIPQYLKASEKTKDMRTTSFSTLKRLEMGTALWVPLGLLVVIVLAILNGSLILEGWILSLLLVEAVFMAFPIYQSFLRPDRKKASTMKRTNYSKLTVMLVFILLYALGLAFFAYLSGINGSEFLSLGILGGVIVIVTFYDLGGMTPVFKSDTNSEREFYIRIDPNRCRGVGYCEMVCPRDCFQVELGVTATIPRDEQCVQCGACIVQCPFDALFFENPKGEKLPPEVVRRYKLNMMGKRTVSID